MTYSEDRFLGALVGLAVGDAIGTTVEFKARGSFPEVTDMTGGGPFSLKPGEWTDDTSMALCLATSLLECKGFDPQDQMQRYVRWRSEGYLSSNGRCFDVGGTIGKALDRFEETGELFCHSDDIYSAGNGSLMRLAPIPMYFADQPAEAIRCAAESSRTTHGALSAADACRYFCGLMIGALQGKSKETVLTPYYSPLVRQWGRSELAPEITPTAAGKFRGKSARDIRGSGYVVESIEAALWAVFGAESYREAVLAAVNLGDDADTTGAICGQLAGALYGLSGIPTEWVDQLAHRDLIMDLARRLMPPH